MKREGKFHVVLFEIISGEHGDEEATREVQVAEATGGPNVVARAMEGFAQDMGAAPVVTIERKQPKPKARKVKLPKEGAPKDGEDAEMRAMLANPEMRGVLGSMLGEDALTGIEKLIRIHDTMTGQPGKAEQS